MSLLSLIRKPLNPVIDSDFAAKIGAMPVSTFDIHEDLEPLFSMEQRFISDLYTRLGWWLDTNIANRLRTICNSEGIAPFIGQEQSSSKLDGLHTALEAFQAEETSRYEQGFDSTGPMTILKAQLHVHERWHGKAAGAMSAINRIYQPTSLTTVISNPRRQTVSSAYLGNAQADALQTAGLLTDINGRRHVSEAINKLGELEQIREGLKLNEAAFEAAIEQKAPGTERATELVQQLKNLSAKELLAVEAFQHDLAKHKEQLDRFYQADLNRIPVMLETMRWVERQLLVEEQEIDFWKLPRQIQIDACEQGKMALAQSLERFRDKPSYVYNSYKNAVHEGVKLLDRVVVTRIEG